MKHRQRVTPGHVGGKYENGNVIEVNVTQHAMWHFANWQLWGRKEDWLAWRGLTGIIGKEEMAAERMKLGAYRGGKATGKELGRKYGPLTSPKNFQENQNHPNVQRNRSENGKKVVPIMNAHPNTKKSQLKNTESGCEKRRKKVRVISLETKECWEFPSIAEACRSLGLYPGHLASVARGERNSHGGYRAEYV